MDFWGYSDFPYPDAINYYERNVDPETGRPRIAGATGVLPHGRRGPRDPSAAVTGPA